MKAAKASPANGAAKNGSGVDRIENIGGLSTHYLDYAGPEPTIVLLHGLSANANEFCGLIDGGLGNNHRVIAPDLRGRGKTGKPASGYSMGEHAADVIGLLDHLGLEQVVLGGHSFGALLAIYIAAHFPARVSKVIVIDAAIVFHPDVVELLQPSLQRLARVLPSADAYMDEMRGAPHVLGFWDDAIEGYFRAEIHENEDGTVQSLTSANAVEQALIGVQSEDWAGHVARVNHPAVLLNASGGFGPPGTPQLVPTEHAMMTAESFGNCRYVSVPGNHLTMVFGQNARIVTNAIEQFLANGAGTANG